MSRHCRNASSSVLAAANVGMGRLHARLEASARSKARKKVASRQQFATSQMTHA
jgi:hypothetical protein